MRCPKCHQRSGNAWGQCEGECPMAMSPNYQNTLYVDGARFDIVREIPHSPGDYDFQRLVLARPGQAPSMEVSVPYDWYWQRRPERVYTSGEWLSWKEDQ